MASITIPAYEYRALKKAESKLRLLEAGGVDNWEWYEASLETYEANCAAIDDWYPDEEGC